MEQTEADAIVESIEPSDLANIAYPKPDDKPDIEPETNAKPDENPEEEGPEEGEPATEEPEGPDTGDDETTEEEEPSEPAADAVLLEEIKGRGLGEFTSMDEFLKAQKELRTRLSQRDDDAAFGRTARERGYDPDPAPAQDRKEKPEGKETPRGTFRPPHEFNPAWSTLVHAKVDENGAETGEYAGPPDEVRKFLEYDAYEKSYWAEVRRDPSKLVSMEMIDRIVSERLDEAATKRQQAEVEFQADAATKAFMEEHGDFVKENDREFGTLLDEGMTPERAIEYLKLKAGVSKPDTGDEAKQKDIDKARKRKTRRAGSTVSTVKAKRKLPSKMTSDELLQSAWESLNEDERAEVLG